MTRLLVLGGSGMLGHKLVQTLAPRAETWATVRGAAPSPAAAAVLDPDRTISGVAAGDAEAVARAVDRSGADVVVNAIGIVKQSSAARDAVPAIAVNALFPHEVAAVCAEAGARLIHISTDCVFSGSRGGYTEDDVPDAADLYGRSKLLGEVAGPGALTLRTSIIGRELSGSFGLLEWFLSRRGTTVGGYPRAVFSGLTTAALADLVGDIALEHPGLDGLWHASAAPIDKLALLRLAREALEVPVEIEPDDALVIDRSLDSTRLREELGWEPASWPAMLGDLAADPTPYEELRHGTA